MIYTIKYKYCHSVLDKKEFNKLTIYNCKVEKNTFNPFTINNDKRCITILQIFNKEFGKPRKLILSKPTLFEFYCNTKYYNVSVHEI